MALVKRHALKQIEQAFKVNPVVGLLGPRQCGKSTLAREYIKAQKIKKVHLFDLEDPRDEDVLQNPVLALEDLSGLIVIDEIQRLPNLYPYIRSLVDKKNRKIKILLLGSASRDLVQKSSESLAGRISYVELSPFDITEVEKSEQLHIRGGFPLSYLAKSQKISHEWRKEYIAAYLERDLNAFGFKIAPSTMRRFWMMLSHYHGQVLNFSEIGKSFGISDMTVRRYLEILSETFMIRLLQPWHENISKRQVKAPKLYFRDSGIFHTFLGAETASDLLTHPKLGASWEGFALEQVLNSLEVKSEDSFFWSTHNESELDLMIFQNGKRIGYEFKYTDQPKINKTTSILMKDLRLDHLYFVSPKARQTEIDRNITAIKLDDLLLG